MLGSHAIDVAIERERARRLVDRFGRNEGPGGELAREQRAHEVSAFFKKESLRRPLTLGSDGVERLEAVLAERRRAQLQAAYLEATPPVVAGLAAPAAPAAATQAFCAASATPASVAATVPAQGRPLPLRALKDATDALSVKSISDLRSLGNGVFVVEVAATAAACAIANVDDIVRVTLQDLDPDQPWRDALKPLGKPGHFMQTLRKFPYAVDAGSVPEENIVGARHYLEMADFASSAAEARAASSSGLNGVNALRHWVRCAVDYYEAWQVEAAAASPIPRPALGAYTPTSFASTPGIPGGGARSARSASQRTALRPGPAVPSSSKSASVLNGSAAKSRSTASPSSRPAGGRSSVGGSGQGPSWASAPRSVTPRPSGARTPTSPQPPRSPMVSAPTGQRTGFGGPAVAHEKRRAASPMPQPGVQAVTHERRRATSPMQQRGVQATTSAPSWSAARGLTSSAVAGTTQSLSSSARAPLTSGAASSTAASRRLSSPRRMSPAPLRPGIGGPAGAGGVVPACASSPQRAGSAAPTACAQPISAKPPAAAEERAAQARALARTAQHRSSASPQPRGARSPSPSPPALQSSVAARGNGALVKATPYGGDALLVAAAKAASTSALSAIGGGRAPGAGNAVSMQDFQRMLEETKKEVREIRSVEAQLRWNMQRDEKRERTENAREDETDLMDWRWKQQSEMKAYVEEKTAQVKKVELEESKNFQEFKREVKVVEKLEEKQLIHEEYLQDTEHAVWRLELAKEQWEKEKNLVVERAEHVKEIRDIKLIEKVQEKISEDEERALEQHLEMQKLARSLQQEKEQLLASLELTRAARRRSANELGAQSGAGARGVGRTPAVGRS